MKWVVTLAGSGRKVTVAADGITTNYGVLTFWNLTGKKPDPSAPNVQHGSVVKAYAASYWLEVVPVDE